MAEVTREELEKSVKEMIDTIEDYKCNLEDLIEEIDNEEEKEQLTEQLNSIKKTLATQKKMYENKNDPNRIRNMQLLYIMKNKIDSQYNTSDRRANIIDVGYKSSYDKYDSYESVYDDDDDYSSSPDLVKCPHCGRLTSEEDFCSWCGKFLFL